tara:strand:+ start:937 stop:1182 length:246 start_codon:yes stop_codon:yes gene_type:complete
MHVLDDHLMECVHFLSDPLSPVKASFALDDDRCIVTIQTDTIPVAASSMSFEQFLNTPANIIADIVKDLYQQSQVRRVYGG